MTWRNFSVFVKAGLGYSRRQYGVAGGLRSVSIREDGLGFFGEVGESKMSVGGQSFTASETTAQ